MARVTVEDCLDHVDNRFELVLLASKRARQIAMGKSPMVERENDEYRRRRKAGRHADDMKDSIGHPLAETVLRKSFGHGPTCLERVASEPACKLRSAPSPMQFLRQL